MSENSERITYLTAPTCAMNQAELHFQRPSELEKEVFRLEDFYVTDLIIVMGQNPGTNHPRMLSALQKAKKNGAKIITINPLPETGLIKFKNPQNLSGWIGSGTQLTDLFLQVNINGDVALLKAIMKLLLEEEEKKPGTVFDHDFINQKTDGFENFIEELKKANVEILAKDCGIDISQIHQATKMILENKKIIVCWAMGLTQHENGVNNIQEVVNLLLLKGSIGKPGAGTCPVRGHSNVQGDRTMGIWEKPKPAFLDKFKREFSIRTTTRAWFRYGRIHQSDGRRKSKNIFCDGRKFSFCHSRHRIYCQGFTELFDDCSSFYEAQSKSFGNWKNCHHFTLPWKNRIGCTKWSKNNL